jgi:hypothetical protein
LLAFRRQEQSQSNYSKLLGRRQRPVEDNAVRVARAGGGYVTLLAGWAGEEAQSLVLATGCSSFIHLL